MFTGEVWQHLSWEQEKTLHSHGYRKEKEIPNLTTWNLNLKNLIPWKTLLLLRCGRDSNPRPLAWQASILTNWTTAPKYSCLYFRINLYRFVINRISHYVLRAENETRTRDPNLGKVVLYQLSYFRIIVGRDRFELPKPWGNRFTVCPF